MHTKWHHIDVIFIVPTNHFRFVIISLKLGACYILQFDTFHCKLFHSFASIAEVHIHFCIEHRKKENKLMWNQRDNEQNEHTKKWKVRIAWLCYLSFIVWVCIIWLLSGNNCHRLRANVIVSMDSIHCIQYHSLSIPFSLTLSLSFENVFFYCCCYCSYSKQLEQMWIKENANKNNKPHK